MIRDLQLELFDEDVTSIKPVEYFERYRNLSFSTQLHGGFGVCTFTIPAPLKEFWLYHDKRFFYRLVITDTSSNKYTKTLFEGRLEDINWNITQEMDLTFLGYWSHLGDKPQNANFNDTADAIIKTILTASFGDINADQSNIEAPDITIQRIEEDEDLTLMELIPRLAEYSDTSFNTWYFAVWEDRIPYFFPRSISTVDWFVNLDQFEGFQLRTSARTLWNSAYAEYVAAGAQTRTATAANAASIAKYGKIKRKAIVGLRDVAQATAEAKRDWWIAEFKDIFPETERIVISGNVTDTNGVTQPLSWVRAGEVIRIRDLIPASADLDAVTRNALNTFYIRETDYDADRNRMIIVPDNPSQGIESIIMRTYQPLDRRGISRV